MRYDGLNDLLMDHTDGDKYRNQLADLRDCINDLVDQIEFLSPKLKAILPFNVYDDIDTVQTILNDIDEKLQL